LGRAGLNPLNHGAHLLRHSLATNLLRRGASLTQIGQVLRHQQTQTTEIYAKVDVNALRALAQPWPGGAQ
jgi:site-specific recombinase XerD